MYTVKIYTLNRNDIVVYPLYTSMYTVQMIRGAGSHQLQTLGDNTSFEKCLFCYIIIVNCMDQIISSSFHFFD